MMMMMMKMMATTMIMMTMTMTIYHYHYYQTQTLSQASMISCISISRSHHSCQQQKKNMTFGEEGCNVSAHKENQK